MGIFFQTHQTIHPLGNMLHNAAFSQSLNYILPQFMGKLVQTSVSFGISPEIAFSHLNQNIVFLSPSVALDENLP